LRVIFLGTAASIPTPNRSLPSIAIRREGELILLDCGEGTQRQMIKAKVGFNRETKILITHMHGDHILGIPGLLQTMSLLGREKPLQIYGPSGIKAFLDSMIETVRFSLNFKVYVHEVHDEGTIYEGEAYRINAAWAEHTIPTLAYSLVEKPRPGRFHPERALALGIPKGSLWSKLQKGIPIQLEDGRVIMPNDVLGPPRPGRKIVYISDSRPSERLVDFARGADLLICEATFADDLAERAIEDKHSTASEAALLAKRAGARMLILTHISARYKDAGVLLKEARGIFPNVLVAEDLMSIDIPLRKD